MSEQPTWETDFRWRRVKVSSALLSEFLRGAARPVRVTTAPPDLIVIGLVQVLSGPAGWYEFVVWSATFDPVPNDGTRPETPFPLIEIEYSV